MTARQINAMLWTAAGACCIAAVGAVVVGTMGPVGGVDQGLNGGGSIAQSAGRTPKPATAPFAPAAEAVFARTLRAPMTDAPTAGAPAGGEAEPGAGNALSLALVGTIGDSLAMIRLADGSVVARAVGEDVAGANVLAIGPAGVEVSIHGRRVLLEKPRPTTMTGVVVEKAS